MTQWYFWGDKQIAGVYENIYIRTYVEDWFNTFKRLAAELKGSNFLDIGCGEGHTTKQILDRVARKHTCDLLEPNEAALNSAKMFLGFENSIGDSFVGTLASFKPARKYDSVFTSHTNYYWAVEEKDYQKQLDKALSLVSSRGKLLILTLPKDSDHYNIMLHQVYPTFNYSSYIADYYKKKGLKVKTIRFKMKMFVGDLLDTDKLYDLQNFYKFIHNTNNMPNKQSSLKFRENIRTYAKKGYIDFKDELIIVEPN